MNTPTPGARPKRPQPCGGSRKGIPNKMSRDVKEMILTALHEAGGAEYLFTQAFDNPKAFLALVGRVLPMQVEGNVDLAHSGTVTVQIQTF
jgi:hypothetical protein